MSHTVFTGERKREINEWVCFQEPRKPNLIYLLVKSLVTFQSLNDKTLVQLVKVLEKRFKPEPLSSPNLLRHKLNKCYSFKTIRNEA